MAPYYMLTPQGKEYWISSRHTCGLTPKGDAFWITAKIGNVVADPLKGETLVKETKVLLVIGETCCIGLPEDTQTVP